MDARSRELFSGTAFADQDHRTRRTGNTRHLLLKPQEDLASPKGFGQALPRCKRPFGGFINHLMVDSTNQSKKQSLAYLL
jgi:hypothetical protein